MVSAVRGHNDILHHQNLTQSLAWEKGLFSYTPCSREPSFLPHSTSFKLTWKLTPGLPSHPELWVVRTVAGFAFVDLGGFTPLQAWNSCLQQRTRSPPWTRSVIPNF